MYLGLVLNYILSCLTWLDPSRRLLYTFLYLSTRLLTSNARADTFHLVSANAGTDLA